MKNIAVITPKEREFRTYVASQNVIDTEHNYIHVNSLNEVYSHKLNDYVTLNTRFNMTNHDLIVKEVLDNINKNGKI